MPSHPTDDQTTERFRDDKPFTMEELRWYYRGAHRAYPDRLQRMNIELVQQVLSAIQSFDDSSAKLGRSMKWMTAWLVVLTIVLVVLTFLLVPEIRGLLRLPAEHP